MYLDDDKKSIIYSKNSIFNVLTCNYNRLLRQTIKLEDNLDSAELILNNLEGGFNEIKMIMAYNYF